MRGGGDFFFERCAENNKKEEKRYIAQREKEKTHTTKPDRTIPTGKKNRVNQPPREAGIREKKAERTLYPDSITELEGKGTQSAGKTRAPCRALG